MNIVFLDVDGVLNNIGTTDISMINCCCGIDDKNLEQLKRLINETHSKIVLSSDWRLDDDLEKFLISRLSEHGLSIYDKTPNLHKYDERGEEIKTWLRKHSDISSWIVLDDMVFRDFSKYEITDRLVLTNEECGLTENDVEKAIDIIRGRKRDA